MAEFFFLVFWSVALQIPGNRMDNLVDWTRTRHLHKWNETKAISFRLICCSPVAAKRAMGSWKRQTPMPLQKLEQTNVATFLSRRNSRTLLKKHYLDRLWWSPQDAQWDSPMKNLHLFNLYWVRRLQIK